MQIIDISRPIQTAPKYPTAPATVLTQINFIERGSESNFTLVSTNTHAGTHVDAKRHFVADGPGIGEMDLSIYYGPIRVLTFPVRALLTRADFEGRIDGAERVGMHGGGFTYLTEEAADYLVEKGVRCLVTDGWSPAPLDNEKAIHRALLLGDVGIVENACFDGVPDGDYTLIAFPANYGGSDGAPARAVLLKD